MHHIKTGKKNTMFNLPHFKLKWGYPKGRIEKGFQREVMDNLSRLWYILFHPADVGLANKFLDLHIISPNKELGWIEFKKINSDSFNVKQFENWQIELLNELDKPNPWEIAEVWIYSVKNNDYKVFSFIELWNMQNEKWGIKIFNNKKDLWKQ